MVRYGRPKGWQIIWVVLCQSVRTNLLFVHCFELCINRIHLHILVLRHGSVSPLAKIGDDKFQLKLELWFVYMLEMLGASLKYRASCWQQYDTTMWMCERKKCMITEESLTCIFQKILVVRWERWKEGCKGTQLEGGFDDFMVW